MELRLDLAAQAESRHRRAGALHQLCGKRGFSMITLNERECLLINKRH